jgi:hypothetical protein
VIPGFEITGTNITDAGMTVNFGVKGGKITRI